MDDQAILLMLAGTMLLLLAIFFLMAHAQEKRVRQARARGKQIRSRASAWDRFFGRGKLLRLSNQSVRPSDKE